jgi:hypothetical protein
MIALTILERFKGNNYSPPLNYKLHRSHALRWNEDRKLPALCDVERHRPHSCAERGNDNGSGVVMFKAHKLSFNQKAII